MMKIKQIPYIFIALALLLSLTGCKATSEKIENNSQEGKIKVVTTLFPYYDFTRQIAGDTVNLTMVVPAGMDSHSFEPTPADMRTIQEADVLICNGGAMEHWLSEVLEAIDTSHMTVLTMMEYVDVYEEELVEGMEDADHDHDHEGHEDHDHEPAHNHQEDYIDHDGHEEEIEYDEHIWTSPVNAMKIVEVISDILITTNPSEASLYETNTKNYLTQLAEIDAGFRQVRENGKRNMIMLGDKFPFRYLAEEYRLDYRAAFSGCSTDTEPSAQTIAYLIDKVQEEMIPVIYYLELSSHRVADIIGEESGATALLLHSCHNVTRAEFDNGVTYIQLMKQNIENLRKGLDE